MAHKRPAVSCRSISNARPEIPCHHMSLIGRWQRLHETLGLFGSDLSKNQSKHEKSKKRKNRLRRKNKQKTSKKLRKHDIFWCAASTPLRSRSHRRALFSGQISREKKTRWKRRICKKLASLTFFPKYVQIRKSASCLENAARGFQQTFQHIVDLGQTINFGPFENHENQIWFARISSKLCHPSFPVLIVLVTIGRTAAA